MLIFNADDYGLSSSGNKQILESTGFGIIKSVSIIANNSAATDLKKIKFSGLSTGVHINLVEGKPLSECATLVNEDGNFFKKSDFLKRLFFGKFNPKEIEKEISSQMEYILDHGVNITHIDSHQNMHLFLPILRIIKKSANKYKIIKIRGQSFEWGWFAKSNSVKPYMRSFYSWFWYQSAKKNFKFPHKVIVNCPGFGLAVNSADTAIKMWRDALLNRYDRNIIYEVPCHLALSDLEYEVYKSNRFLHLLKELGIKIGNYYDL